MMAWLVQHVSRAVHHFNQLHGLLSEPDLTLSNAVTQIVMLTQLSVLTCECYRAQQR